MVSEKENNIKHEKENNMKRSSCADKTYHWQMCDLRFIRNMGNKKMRLC